MPNTKVNKILEEAYARGAEAAKNGKVATYIPELSKADPADLGICLCLPDGTRYEIGDTPSPRWSLLRWRWNTAARRKSSARSTWSPPRKRSTRSWSSTYAQTARTIQ